MAFTNEEMAVLSQLAYRDIHTSAENPVTLAKILDENWTYLTTALGEEYAKVLEGIKAKANSGDYRIVLAENDRYGTGFAAFAIADPNNEVTVACRGTEGFDIKNEDSVRDIITDAQIGLSVETNQQQKLEEFLEELEKGNYEGYYFTGHSLGGNLAIHGAITIGDSSKVKGVVTFNAPGFNNYYWMTHRIKIEQVKDKILNIENEYDYVSSIFTKPGETIYVDSNFSKDDYGFSHHNLSGLCIGANGGFKRTDKKGKRTDIVSGASNGGVDIAWNLGIIGQYIKAKITGCAKTGFRDFSQSALDMMVDIAKEVEDEDWWDVTKWDCWYRMDKLFGSFVMDYQLMSGDVDTYYRKVIDMNNASAGKIKDIFEKAYATDEKYSKQMVGDVTKMQDTLAKMRMLSLSVRPSIHTGDWGGTAAGSQIPGWQPGTQHWHPDILPDVQPEWQPEWQPEGNSGILQDAIENMHEYGGLVYNTVNGGFQDHIMSQNAYDGPQFGYGAYNCGCTATAWCAGLSMITGKEYNPTDASMWNEGALFPGQGNSVWGNGGEMLKEAYKQLQDGKPSIFYAQHPYNVMHAVTIVGISPNANPSELKMSDFLVVDPWGGQVKTLDQVGYSGGYGNGSRLITYGSELP